LSIEDLTAGQYGAAYLQNRLEVGWTHVIRFTEVAIGIALQGHVTGGAPQIEVNEVTMSALGH
jgi:hypothetical protein